MAGKFNKVLRCAIYTRKSTEHGLELEFNSLDAQREACEAYIKSQASEDWRVLPARYDDPKLRRFAERVEVRAEPSLRGVAAIVEIETIGGESFRARCEEPLGAPENRLSLSQIEAKFRTCASGRLSPSQVEDVIGEVPGLELQASVRTLMDTLRATPQGAVSRRTAGLMSVGGA